MDEGLFRWKKDSGRRVGKHCSGNFIVKNGTPQGSMMSPLLLKIIINNDFYLSWDKGLGCSLFADDGIELKRGRHVEFITKKIQVFC